jgi:hypothetical protein
MKFFIPITKVTERPDGSCDVYGVAADETMDDVKEIFDYDTSKPHFEEWSAGVYKATEGKSYGNIRAMHNKIAAGKATQLLFDDPGKAIHLGAHIVDTNEAKKCIEGVYSGFSIGGSYINRWPDTNQRGAFRYTAKPVEISIVDIPCNPDASFKMVKMDGTEELRKFAPVTPERLLHQLEYTAEKHAESFSDLLKFLKTQEASAAAQEPVVEKEEIKTEENDKCNAATAAVEKRPHDEEDDCDDPDDPDCDKRKRWYYSSARYG